MADPTLEELERLEAAATKGELLIERRDRDEGLIDYILYSVHDVAWCPEGASENARADAKYLQALYNAAPSLIAAAKRVAELEREREWTGAVNKALLESQERLAARVAELEREKALLRGRLPCEHHARKSHGRHEWYVDVAGSGDGYCRACGAIGTALAGRGGKG